MLLRTRRNIGPVVSPAAGKLRLAMVEFSPEWEKTPENLSRLDAVAEGIFSGAIASPEGDGGFLPDILVLPECFSTGFTMNPHAAEIFDSSASLSWMLRTAGLYDCAVAASVPVWEPASARYNRFFFVTPDGVLATYDKRHLFFGGEEEAFTPGTSRTVFQYKGWRIMPGICFDLRFPVWGRNDMEDPYDLYINVANWPAARKKASETLAAARAIENVAYVAFCNRAGRDPLMDYAGGSAVFNHRGRERSFSSAVCGTGVVCAVLDMAEMLRYRASFPVLGKSDAYRLG